jgi:hypothetical protein
MGYARNGTRGDCKSKINVKSGGQKCPPHTGSGESPNMNLSRKIPHGP